MYLKGMEDKKHNKKQRLGGREKKRGDIVRYSQKLPSRILLLITVQRAGSTWFFDALRCHPAIYVHPGADILKALCVSGRRYPADLSGKKNSKLKIEVTPDEWDKIPNFEIKEGKKFVCEEIIERPYAIEKFHPHFFEHNFKPFLQNFSKLEKKATIRIIYLVRDPKSVMSSFLNYQKRNPSWHKHINQDKLPQYLKQSYDSVLRTAMEHKGLIVDYEELIKDFHPTIARVFNYLWSDKTNIKNGSTTELTDMIAKITARDKRQTKSTLFLGKKAGPVSGEDKEYKDFFTTYAEEIDRCYLTYRLLLKFKQLNHPFTKEQIGDSVPYSSLPGELPALIKEITTQNLETQNLKKMTEGKNEIILVKDETIRRKEKMIANRNESIEKQKQIIGNRDESIKKQKRMVANRDESIEKQKQIIDNRDESIKKQKRMVANRDESIEKQKQIIDNRDESIKKQKRMVANRDQIITDMQNSLSFKITALLRNIRIKKDQIFSTMSHFAESTREKTSKLPAQARLRIRRYRFKQAGKGVGITWNERNLLALKNRYAGRRAFIIGNGPSLLNTDVRKLKDEITIACNGIFLLFEETGFRPSFYTVEDILVAEDRASTINTLKGFTKIIPIDLKHWIKPDKNTIYINFVRRVARFPRFADRFEQFVFWGGTVTFLNLELAYYLGIREVYLIGIDHNYQPPAEVDEIDGPKITSRSDDVNHFHPDYFGPGYRWHDPKVERMEQGYREAKRFFEANGGVIYNATAGGKLEVFPRVDFTKVVKE